MKNSIKIIIATDFTEASDNAINYINTAFNQGYGIQPEYLLVHGFKPLTPYSNSPSIPVMENDKMDKVLRDKLNQLEEKLQGKLGKDAVSQYFGIGSLNEVLSDAIEQHGADLIVMGSRPKGAFQRMTVGSNTLEVSNTVGCPLLAIPQGAQFNNKHKVSLATSLDGQTLSNQSLKIIKLLTSLENMLLNVVHVFESDDDSEMNKKMETSALHQQLTGLSHNHSYLVGSDVATQLSEHIAQEQPDMIAMAPSEKSFFDKIFHQSKTEKMIYHEGIPTLLLT